MCYRVYAKCTALVLIWKWPRSRLGISTFHLKIFSFLGLIYLGFEILFSQLKKSLNSRTEVNSSGPVPLAAVNVRSREIVKTSGPCKPDGSESMVTKYSSTPPPDNGHRLPPPSSTWCQRCLDVVFLEKPFVFMFVLACVIMCAKTCLCMCLWACMSDPPRLWSRYARETGAIARPIPKADLAEYLPFLEIH